MAKQITLSTFLILLFYCFNSSAQVQTDQVSLENSGKQLWYVRAASEVSSVGEDNLEGWTPAIVPGTVFTSFVTAGKEKDPNFGDNVSKVDRRKYDRSFWYRTEFSISESYLQKRIWLNFDGVNRHAAVYLNNKLLGKLDGFMMRGKYDITEIANKSSKNVLLVLVSPPIQPLANIGSPNYVSSAGWDWMPYVPGLNSGITDKVYLSSTGDLTLVDPWVRTNLPTNAKSYLSVATGIRNDGEQDLDAELQGTIMPGNIRFSKKIRINHGSTEDVKLTTRDFEELIINNPKLWWPNGYGEPNMYDLDLRLEAANKLSDEKHVKFGIKRYSYDTTGHVLHISVNGTPVFIKGGDWGMSEYMLRCRGTEYDTKLRLHKEMNFNMIRNWIGSVTDEEFYDACDKYGMMVWDEFWLNSNPNLPADINCFNANAIEKIKRERNHPSIAVWCADNEGWPEPPLNNWLREDVRVFDAGDRWYQPNSHAEGLTGSGPWMAKDPRYYFTPFPTGLGGNKGWGFRTELGTAVFVNYESFKKFMPQKEWWPRNEMWNQHFFGPSAFNAGPDEYDEMIALGYGIPRGIEDYCRKAQFVNLESNKAMYEGWLDHMGEDASGIMTWMSQSAYPSMVWQTYDYYYDLTGAYFGAKIACEPLHIQWNPVSNAVKVINTSGSNVQDLKASADIYNLDGHLINQYSKSASLNSSSNTVAEVFKLEFNNELIDIAKGRKIFASSSPGNDAANANDGNTGSRWASKYNDDEWICTDLGKTEVINGIGLNWENAYAKSYKIEVSDDNEHWYKVYQTDDGRVGWQKINFPEVNARYVRMHGIERGSWWGYSLYDFEVYKGNLPSQGLSDVHFIKLKLTDLQGKVISDNFYWRGNKRKDYTALNQLKPVNLKVNYKTVAKNGKTHVTLSVTNPATSGSAAFGIRLLLTGALSGEQILPAIFSDNYFALMSGETKLVNIEFDSNKIGKGGFKLDADLFNNHVAR